MQQINVSSLVEWYLQDCQLRNLQEATVDYYRIHLGYLVKELGDCQIDSITLPQIKSVMRHLATDRKWSTSHANHWIQVIKGFFSYLEQEEVLESSPAHRMQKIKQEQHHPDPLSQKEIEKLLSVIPDDKEGHRDRLMILTMLDTGLRVAELIALRVGDIDIANSIIRVKCGKGRKERRVPISPRLRKMLFKFLGTKGEDEALWIAQRGSNLTKTAIQWRLRNHGKIAGIANVHPHRFRHTFATEFLRNGGTVQMLQLILGHTTIQMTMKYTHLVDVDAVQIHRQASPLQRWQL